MGLPADSATKNSDLGLFGDFWGDGADSAQKVDTLAGRRVSSTPGKRLAEARRASLSASLGEVMTHLKHVQWMAAFSYGACKVCRLPSCKEAARRQVACTSMRRHVTTKYFL
jgi:hypothetical protein